MAHFAKISENKEVLQVLTLNNSDMLNADNVEDDSRAPIWLLLPRITSPLHAASGDTSQLISLLLMSPSLLQQPTKRYCLEAIIVLCLSARF